MLQLYELRIEDIILDIYFYRKYKLIALRAYLYVFIITSGNLCTLFIQSLIFL